MPISLLGKMRWDLQSFQSVSSHFLGYIASKIGKNIKKFILKCYCRKSLKGESCLHTIFNVRISEAWFEIRIATASSSEQSSAPPMFPRIKSYRLLHGWYIFSKRTTSRWCVWLLYEEELGTVTKHKQGHVLSSLLHAKQWIRCVAINTSKTQTQSPYSWFYYG